MHALKTNLKCRMAKIRLVGNRLIEDFLHKSKKILQMFSQFTMAGLLDMNPKFAKLDFFFLFFLALA